MTSSSSRLFGSCSVEAKTTSTILDPYLLFLEGKNPYSFSLRAHSQWFFLKVVRLFDYPLHFVQPGRFLP